MTCHPLYAHPFGKGARLTPVEYHAIVTAAISAGMVGIFAMNKRIAKSREVAVRNVYFPN